MATDPVGVRSKLLFGNTHLLEMAALIAEMDSDVDVRAQEIERVTGLVASTVHRSLTRLSAANLLVRLDREPGEREQRYARQAHPFWDAALTLRAEQFNERSDKAFPCGSKAPRITSRPRI